MRLDVSRTVWAVLVTALLVLGACVAGGPAGEDSGNNDANNAGNNDVNNVGNNDGNNAGNNPRVRLKHGQYMVIKT